MKKELLRRRGALEVISFRSTKSGAGRAPLSVEIHYLCSVPISVDPICPQPIIALSHILSWGMNEIWLRGHHAAGLDGQGSRRRGVFVRRLCLDNDNDT